MSQGVRVVFAAIAITSSLIMAPDRTMAQRSSEAQSRLDDILQRKDKALRQRRLDETLATLKDPKAEPRAQRDALALLAGAGEIPFDRAPFLPAAKVLLASPSADVRAAALSAMPGLGATVADLPAMASLAKDSAGEVRARVAPAMESVRLRPEQLEEARASIYPAIEALVDDPSKEVKLGTLHALWGRELSPAIEEKVIALSRESMAGGPGALGYDAVYYGLSTRPEVRPAVADRLIELLRDGRHDPNVRWRAAWGLGHKATPEAVDRIVKALADELDETLQPTIRDYAVRGLAAHRTPAALAKLREVAEKDENPGLREAAARAVGKH